MVLALILALAAAAPADPLDRLAAALRGAPAWRAEFAQTYTPQGFDAGTSETGVLTVAPPARLRFDYTSGSPRAFASDGSVGRLVDPGAGTCEAVRLDAGTLGRLPLAAALDPAATRRAFTVAGEGTRLRLVPKEATPELAEIAITLRADGLPETVVVRDASGDRNAFAFKAWRSAPAPQASFFRPALPGATPCEPDR